MNVIRISNANASNNLTLTGILANAASSCPTCTAPPSIEDDITSTTLSDSTVALYALGEGDVLGGGGGIIGHSRFTTSPSVPNWSVGSGGPISSPACITGTLFTNTSGTSGSHDTLYVCEGGVWAGK